MKKIQTTVPMPRYLWLLLLLVAGTVGPKLYLEHAKL